MSFQIELQEPNTTFRPGSTISGSVKLTSKTDESISAVAISFRGRCKIKIRSSEHYTTRSYRSSAIYFHEKQSLYEGKFTHKAGAYAWPFTFTIPEYAQPQIAQNAEPSRPKRQLDSMGMLKLDLNDGGRPKYDFFTARSPWRGSKDLRLHPILDSFTYVHSRWPLDWEGRVEYTLFATLSRPPSSFLFPAKDLEAKGAVRVGQSGPANFENLLLERQVRELRQTVAMGRSERRMSSLMDRTQTLFRAASGGPKWTLAVEVTTASNIIPGGRLPFLLQVSDIQRLDSVAGTKGSADSATPVLRLQSFSFFIKMTTAVRDNALTALEQTAEKSDTLAVSRQKGLSIGIPTMSSESIDIGDSFDVRLPDDVAPSFSTYNIHRAYCLGFEFKIDCAGQTVTFSDNSMRILVLPKMDEVSGRGAVPEYQFHAAEELPNDEKESAEELAVEDKKDETGTTGPPPPREHDEEQLPAYQPSERPGYEPVGVHPAAAGRLGQ